MEKLLRHPSRSMSCRRTFTPKAWKVDTVRFWSFLPVFSFTRSSISLAALLVKVRARIWLWGMPLSSMWAMRYVMTLVLPLPAPAMMSSGPSVVVTASNCSWFSSCRSLSSMGAILWKMLFCCKGWTDGIYWKKIGVQLSVTLGVSGCPRVSGGFL